MTTTDETVKIAESPLIYIFFCAAFRILIILCYIGLRDFMSPIVMNLEPFIRNKKSGLDFVSVGNLPSLWKKVSKAAIACSLSDTWFFSDVPRFTREISSNTVDSFEKVDARKCLFPGAIFFEMN